MNALRTAVTNKTKREKARGPDITKKKKKKKKTMSKNKTQWKGGGL